MIENQGLLYEGKIYRQCTNENCTWHEKFIENPRLRLCQICASPVKRVKVINGEVKDLEE